VVLCALGSSLLLSHRDEHSFRWTGLAGFLPYFLWHSLRGGVDVSRRALSPRISLAPSFLDYPLRLPAGSPRLFLTNVMSMLPGTLSVELLGDCLRVHVLDATADVFLELEELESRVAGVFGLKVPCRLAGGGLDRE